SRISICSRPYRRRTASSRCRSRRRCSRTTRTPTTRSARCSGRRLTLLLALEQGLNGLQFGVMLFLMAAGLTLVFGIMNLVNLAHGSFYMVGAYLATTFFSWTGSFVAAVVLSLLSTLAVGVLVELIALRTLYERDHLDQVLATFGLILLFNELIAILWGRAAIYTA